MRHLAFELLSPWRRSALWGGVTCSARRDSRCEVFGPSVDYSSTRHAADLTDLADALCTVWHLHAAVLTSSQRSWCHTARACKGVLTAMRRKRNLQTSPAQEHLVADVTERLQETLSSDCIVARHTCTPPSWDESARMTALHVPTSCDHPKGLQNMILSRVCTGPKGNMMAWAHEQR